uniref:Uncharacterized protein n=1 Tax=Peronospora matthiolae TaxID=2874970 RepID=A0AAV1VII7_9STRA
MRALSQQRDTWEPSSSLLQDGPDGVLAYVSVHALDPDLVDDVIIVAVSEIEKNDDGVVLKRYHDYETNSYDTKNAVKRHHDVVNVALNVYYHDHANENVVATVWHHIPENVSVVASLTHHK